MDGWMDGPPDLVFGSTKEFMAKKKKEIPLTSFTMSMDLL
jgi:hypothetical protein